MTVTYAGGLSPETPLAPRSLLRATFGTNFWAIGADRALLLRNAYDKLASALPAASFGYLASPLAVGPSDEAMTVDIRRDLLGQPTGAQAATLLQDAVGTLGPDKVDLTRLALVSSSEGATAAQVDRQKQTAAEVAQPTVIDTVLQKAQSVGTWFLWVLALLAVILVAYVFH